jgi:hypothetical protein
MINMKHMKIIISTLAVLLITTSSFNVYGTIIHYEQNTDLDSLENDNTFAEYTSKLADLPTALAVSDSNPFYALIATPLAVHYNELGEQTLIPLYIKHFDNPSKAVERAEEQTGIYADYIIGDLLPPTETSLLVADTFWQSCPSALIIKEDQAGYELGITAVPLASYLNIPVIITDELNPEILDLLDNKGVEHLFICGNFNSSDIIPFQPTFLTTREEIIELCITIITNRFGQTVDYITMANPLDVYPPQILDITRYEFNGSINSIVILPTQFINMMLKGGSMGIHEFTIPEDYKYTQLKIDLINLDPENVEKLGDRLNLMILSPDGDRYIFGGTHAGIPLRTNDGTIIQDQLHFEITIYDKPGIYELMVFGQIFGSKSGSYTATVTLEKLDNPLVPLMPGLSSIAPYLTAYHKGIMFAKSEFAFAADDHVLFEGSPCPGVSQPGTNPLLIVPSNEHTMNIHNDLTLLVANLANIPIENLEELRNHYKDNPLNIAIAADPTMVPMYFYYNPDGRPDAPAHTMGFACPSDFIYADIDPIPEDPENNTFSYWPFMENIVGRVTGWDAQDCSALLARTFFYNTIIENMGDWKNNALVQTGCGLEFQNLPIVTRLGKLIGRITGTGRDEPTKWPTGESMFMNMRLTSKMELGGYNVKNTFWLQSQREGFESVDDIKKTGLLNRLLFPKRIIEFLSSADKVTGGQDQLSSSLIFAFAHGFYNLYEFGDILIDARGFPFITPLSRIYPSLRSSLSNKGSFDIRSIENMEYGPTVIFVVSCITGRTDGMNANNTLSQIYLHSGANAYIGATRVTADPGYLEPRPLPGGWGIGILGFMKAYLNWKLRKQFPDAHFGAVIAEDFILQLIEQDATTGLALRNAKNLYLPKDANTTFLWTPPLTLSSGCSFIDQEFLSAIGYDPFGRNDRTRVLDKKYVALHEFQLYGDPAFNPYQPVNNG